MLHLIHKSYLERVEFFPKMSPKQEDQTFIFHPENCEVLFDGEFLEDFLDDHFESSFGKLFEYLGSSIQELVLYVTEEDFFEVAVVFWSSILRDSSFENLILLYDSYEKNRLINFPQKSDPLHQFKVFNKSNLSSSKMKEIYDYTKKDCADIGSFFHLLSLEYLFASTYMNNDQYEDQFLSKVQSLIDHYALEEVFSLRNLILKSLYTDINSILMDHEKLEYDKELISQLKESSSLGWIIDPHFNKDNSLYVRQYFNDSNFEALYEKIKNTIKADLLKNINEEVLLGFFIKGKWNKEELKEFVDNSLSFSGVPIPFNNYLNKESNLHLLGLVGRELRVEGAKAYLAALELR